VSGEILIFILLGAAAAFFIYLIVRHGGFKGALFGAKISSSIGEVAGATRGLGSQKLKVHVLDANDPAAPRVGIELTSSTPLSWNTVPIKLSDDAVRELISLLEQSLGSVPPRDNG
jgi:hypothetical protein